MKRTATMDPHARRPFAVILTGGRSQRMGRDKALLEVEGRALVTHVATRIAAFCDGIVAVDPLPERLAELELPVVRDAPAGSGPLAGLDAGLAAASHDPVLLVGCDMPFVRAELIARLAERMGDADAAAVRTADGLEPLAALYRRSVRTRIAALLEDRPRAGLRALLDTLSVAELPEAEARAVDPTLESLVNLNRPTDLERHLHRLSGGRAGDPGSA